MYWDVDASTRIMENSGGDGWQFGSGYHTPLWIFTEVSIGDLISVAVDAEGEHLFQVTGETIYELPGIGPIGVFILEDLTVPGGVAMYEQGSGILISGQFYYSGGDGLYTLNYVESNVGLNFTVDHELSVSLDIPNIYDILNSYTINATVTNYGSNDEYNVDLFLYLEGIAVASTTISNLPVGANETVSYNWTPIEYGFYNFTAYTPILPDEAFINNNYVTEIIALYNITLFDGMYIHHNLTDYNIGTSTSNIIYSYNSARMFDVSWNLVFETIYIWDNWQVDFTSREISGNTIYFYDYTHTPFWIFTNVSLGDHVLISSIWDGDHIFEVSDELVYDLSGFGLVDVWVLQDLAYSNATVWYEKSTGILLNGTFYYQGGFNYIIFDFIDTNVEFSHTVAPGAFDLTTDANIPFDEDGMFNLMWPESVGANNYSVYQHSSYITVINDSLITLLEDTTDLQLHLDGYSDGTYYFIIVAENDYGDTKSNCIEVTVDIPHPPEEFDLSTDADTPNDGDGAFNLFWTESIGANDYSVYQHSSYITVINGSLTPLAEEITEQELPLSGYSNGRYFFIIVAYNDIGETLSNCISVMIFYEGGGGEIPGYELLFIIGTLGIALILLKKRISKKIKNNY